MDHTPAAENPLAEDPVAEPSPAEAPAAEPSDPGASDPGTSHAPVSEAAAQRPPLPPFTRETALAKVQAAEDAWNSRDPERCAGAYTIDTVWRNRDEELHGRDEVIAFLRRKWQRELGYRLRKNLWAVEGNRIAVRFQYEWHDEEGQWWRSYGNENWEFDENGFMARREAAINDLPIDHDELRVTPGEGELPPF